MAGSPIRGVFAIALCLQLSCATKPGIVPAPASTEVYDFTTEGHFPEPPQRQRVPTSLASPPVIPLQVDPGEATTVQGWRVQVFAGHSLEIAQRIQQELQVELAEEVYIDYVDPYYKVRVGDCAARATCEELLQELHTQGRQSAWVVASVIHR